MSGKDVFIVGPGFIGWVVLTLLVKEGYSVTAFCRRKEHGEALTKSGASRIVLGDLGDHDTIAAEAAAHSIVLHTATADDLPSVQAVLDGVRKRIAAGKPALYIHTSGTSLFDDKCSGNVKGDKVYEDTDPAAMDALDDEAPHRPIDLTIVRALREEFKDKAKIAIMVPPEIYGYNEWNGRLSIQIPVLTKFALKHGYAGHVGKGLAVESQIHVNDLARAYVYLLHYMEDKNAEATLKNPYFYCENGKTFSWLEVAQNIGKGLHSAGKISSPEPKQIDPKDYSDLWGDFTDAVVGLNSISKAVRLRQLGWEPKEKGIWESYYEDELPAILAQEISK